MAGLNHPFVVGEADTLCRLLKGLLPPGAIGSLRLIEPTDESFLTASEALTMGRAVASVLRASGAARHVARQLFPLLRLPPVDIPRSGNGAPVWPPGVIGSIAHDRDLAVAVIARSGAIGGIGVDVEPAEPLEADIFERVARDGLERLEFHHDPLDGKALFAIKEAVFKAVYPHDGVFLDFHEVTVDRTSRIATTRYGRRVQWRAVISPRVLATAWW